jgi:SAM-dependent methyltransferase
MDLGLVGLFEAAKGGWFQGGQLCPGFQVGADDVVLDAGCGGGGYAAWAGMQGAHVAFFDVDKDAVAEAEARVRATAAREVTARVAKEREPIPFADGFASKILCTEVLEHVDDPEGFLRELVRCARPGCEFLITVPAPLSEFVQRRVAPAAFFEKPEPGVRIRGLSPGHLRTFSDADFAALIVGCGLTVERRYSMGFFWAVYFAMFWACDVDFGKGSHPALNYWTRAWHALLQTQDSDKVKSVLDEALPKSQVIVARKPG